ncbi:MAG: PQQ-binding-like beta-propeller repeat protein [Candidatus Anstonellales archaeon]
MKKIFLLFLFFSVFYSVAYWSVSGGGELFDLGTKVGVTGEKTMVLEKETGAVVFEKNIKSIAIAGAQNFVVVTKDKIYYLDGSGNVKWEKNMSNLTGMAVASNRFFVTSDTGVYAFDYDGRSIWNVSENSTKSPPVYGEGMVAYYSGNELVVYGDAGNLRFRREIGKWWKSIPEIKGGMVYANSFGNLYAFTSEGKMMWKKEFNDWVYSPKAYGNIVCVGTGSAGYIVDMMNGKTLWKIDMDESYFYKPDVIVEGNNVYVLFFGRNAIHVVDAQRGKILVEFTPKESITGKAGNNPAVVSTESKIYASNPLRGCSIKTPETEVFGYKDVKIEGNAHGKGEISVFIRVNNGGWESAEGGEEWNFWLDPNKYNFGEILVECKILDSSGEENPPFTYKKFLRSPDMPKGKFIVSYPEKIKEGQKVTFTVTDEEGNPVRDYIVEMGGLQYKKDGNAVLTMRNAGRVEIVFKKDGFEEKKIYVDVEGSPLVLVFLAAGLIILVLVLRVFGLERIRKLISSSRPQSEPEKPRE